MKLRPPGRSVLDGLTGNTCEAHRRWIVDSKRFGVQLEVAPGIMWAPDWHLCLSYEQKIRDAAMDLISLQDLPFVRGIRSSQERPRAQDDPLGATVDTARATEVCFSSSPLFRILQLCQALPRSPARGPVLRRESAFKQSAVLAGRTRRRHGNVPMLRQVRSTAEIPSCLLSRSSCLL